MSDVKRKFGWKPAVPTRPTYGMHKEMQIAVAMPPTIDLSPQFSPIEDQGEFGSCVGHGTVGALEYLEIWELAAKLKPGTNAPEVFADIFNPLSRAFVYDNARIIDGTSLSQDAGTTITSAIRSIKQAGICRETTWPYAAANLAENPSAAAYAEAQLHKIVWDYQLDNRNLNQLKQCLAWKYPVVFGITCYQSMMTEDVLKTGYIPFPAEDEQALGGHCMCLVGYDDASSRFKVRNSWGTSWGDQGYGYIDYAYLTNPYLASDFWTLRKNSPNV